MPLKAYVEVILWNSLAQAKFIYIESTRSNNISDFKANKPLLPKQPSIKS